VAAAFVSTIASAAVTYGTSVGASGSAQTANAKVAAGGSSVRANDLTVQAGVGGATPDIPADAEIIVRLPAGLNFDGAPTYLVTAATPTQGLTLKDGTEFGDPTLDDPGVSLFDTNGDGGMDRALVTVAAAAAAGDTLTISINLKAGSTVKAGVKKASVIVNAGLAVTQDIVEVVTSLQEPISPAATSKLSTADQNETLDVATLTSVIEITIPKGTLNGKTITLKPQSGIRWATSTTTVTLAGVMTPVSVAPLTATTGSTSTLVGPATSTTTLSYSVQGGDAVTGLATDTQVRIQFDMVDVLAGAVGLRGVTIAGSAGISGTAPLVNVLQNDSNATLTVIGDPNTNVAAEIVAGASVPQTLPSITVKENFDGDAGGNAVVGMPGTDTITITAGDGLKFVSATNITVGWSATVSVNTGSKSISVVIDANPDTDPTPADLVISGITAVAESTATGNLSLTVGTPGSNANVSTGPNDTLVVAKAVALGTVSVTGPAKLGITGPGGATQTAKITLKESTYGAISIANKTGVQDAYIRVTPSSNASITAVTTTVTAYPATAPVFDPCYAEANVTTGAWICEVTAESTQVTPTTSAVSINVDVKANGGTTPAPIGSTIELTLGGNAAVTSDAIPVVSVGVATTATKGAIPDLTPGETEAQDLSKLTITENFNGAISAGKFRLIAPTGVTFNNADSVISTTSTGGVQTTPTITATFSPNDTLVITVGATKSVSFTAQAVIGPDKTGYVGFNITDGDINGLNKTGITKESINLAYADGTLGAVDAGDNATVNVGFTVANTAEGGLVPYTVASGSTAIATASVSGSTVKVTGKSTGTAIITLTDALGNSDTYSVDVTAGTAQPEAKAAKGIGGSAGDATFSGGASSDGGATFADTFSTTDDVTIVGTVNVGTTDQGVNGEIHVVILSITDAGAQLAYLDEDGGYPAWDQTVEGLGAHIVATPLAASYSVTVFAGNLLAGTHRVALAYSTADGKLVFTGKAVSITVTE
jgi:hypothetical protein